MKGKLRLVLVGGLLIAVAVVGAQSWHAASYENSQRSVLEHSDTFVLYSLKPYGEDDGPNLPYFYYGRIQGKARITDKKTRTLLVEALYSGMSHPGLSGDCFNPGYGIRATRGKRTVDVELCYGCGNIRFYENGKSSDKYPTSREPDKVYRQALKAAHLPPPG